MSYTIQFDYLHILHCPIKACTEMVMPMSSSRKDSMFPAYEFDYASYKKECLEDFGVKPRPRWITTEFGGHVSSNVYSHAFLLLGNGYSHPFFSLC